MGDNQTPTDRVKTAQGSSAGPYQRTPRARSSHLFSPQRSRSQRNVYIGQKRRGIFPVPEDRSNRDMKHLKRESSGKQHAVTFDIPVGEKGQKLRKCPVCENDFEEDNMRAQAQVLGKICRVKGGCLHKLRSGLIEVYKVSPNFYSIAHCEGAKTFTIVNFGTKDGKRDYTQPVFQEVEAAGASESSEESAEPKMPDEPKALQKLKEMEKSEELDEAGSMEGEESGSDGGHVAGFDGFRRENDATAQAKTQGNQEGQDELQILQAENEKLRKELTEAKDELKELRKVVTANVTSESISTDRLRQLGDRAMGHMETFVVSLEQGINAMQNEANKLVAVKNGYEVYLQQLGREG